MRVASLISKLTRSSNIATAIRGWLSESSSRSNEAVTTVRHWMSGSLSKSDESWKNLGHKFSFPKNRNDRHELVALAVQSFKRDEFTEAIHHFSEAIRMKPKSNYYKMRGNCHLELKQFKLAADDYQEVVNRHPEDENTRLLLCETLLHAQEYARARHETVPLASYELITLGDRLFGNERYIDAIFCYNEALLKKKSPEEEPVYYGRRGMCFWKMGHLKKAEDDFKHITEIAPEFIRSWIHLSEVLLEEGKTTEARSAFENFRKIPDQMFTNQDVDEMNNIKSRIEKLEKVKKEQLNLDEPTEDPTTGNDSKTA